MHNSSCLDLSLYATTRLIEAIAITPLTMKGKDSGDKAQGAGERKNFRNKSFDKKPEALNPFQSKLMELKKKFNE